jgi:transposase
MAASKIWCSMIKLHLSDKEFDDVAEALDSPEVSEHAKRKLLVITMHHQGAQHGFIENCLRISSPTLVTYLKEYQQGGLATVLENRYYKPSSSLEPYWQCLICSFTVAPVATAKAAMARIETLTGVKLSESQCRRVMKKMGMTLKKSAPLPGKLDSQLQFDFFATELQPRLHEASQGQRKVFFVDAAHFVLGAFLGLIWCFARPFLRTAPGRQRYSILGAVDSHSKELVSIRTTDTINAAVVCALLEQIASRYPEQPTTLVMDNARYQHCALVKNKATELNIELLFLPPYSPNLNLIERLWKLVKKRCLTNRYYENFGRFRAAIDHCLDDLDSVAKAELESLLTLKFQFFEKLKT